MIKLAEDFAPAWLFTMLEMNGWLGESAAQVALRMGHDVVASLIHRGIPVVEQQVRAVFREHDPSKLGTVSALLAEFAGREWELLQELRETYGELIDELVIVPGSDRALISPDSRMREAATRGDYPSVVAFVKEAHTFKGGVDATDDQYGQSALMAAAGGGHEKVVNLLLDSGADADKLSYAGVSALIGAAHNGHVEVARLLLEVGNAGADMVNEAGSAPLAIAAGAGRLEMVSLLLQHGADVNHRREDGATALVDAATWGHDDCLRTLLGAGAGIDIPHREGWTALMIATQEGRLGSVEQLLDAGANFRLRTDHNGVVLMHAAQKNQVDVTRKLLDAGAGIDINVQDMDGVSALMVAAKGGHGDMVKLLLLHGADHTLTSRQSSFFKRALGWLSSFVMRTMFTAAEMAVVGGHLAVADLIYSHEAAWSQGFKPGTEEYSTAMAEREQLMAERLMKTTVEQGLFITSITAEIAPNKGKEEPPMLAPPSVKLNYPPAGGGTAAGQTHPNDGEPCGDQKLFGSFTGTDGQGYAIAEGGQICLRAPPPAAGLALEDGGGDAPLDLTGKGKVHLPGTGNTAEDGLQADALSQVEILEKLRADDPSATPVIKNLNPQPASPSGITVTKLKNVRQQPKVVGTPEELLDTIGGSPAPTRRREVLKPLKSTKLTTAAEAVKTGIGLPVLTPTPVPPPPVPLPAVADMPAGLSWPAFGALCGPSAKGLDMKTHWELYKLHQEAINPPPAVEDPDVEPVEQEAAPPVAAAAPGGGSGGGLKLKDVVSAIREEVGLDAALAPKDVSWLDASALRCCVGLNCPACACAVLCCAAQVIAAAASAYGVEVGEGSLKQQVGKLAAELGIETGW